MLILGGALLVTALILRSAGTNRHVRGRLLFSALAFFVYAGCGVALTYRTISPELHQNIVDFTGPLILAFGLINAIVALVVNPWRQDRLPDRFPTIVQDSIVIILFAVAATLILQERIFATTAVGAVVVGFALQDTLGNLFAGLAIQVEKPFRVGHWVHIAGKDGLVKEITWRATKIRTKAGNFVIVPNNVLSKDTITNYSEPVLDTRLELDVPASYDAPPNHVKQTILAAIRDEPLLSPAHTPEVLLVGFADSSATYRIRVWTADFAADEILKDRVRSAVYYAFRRAAIDIPYPFQVQIEAQPKAARDVGHPLGRIDIFSALTDEERDALTRAAHRGLYAAGDRVVREGTAGSSMFVVAHGEVAVVIEPDREVARIAPGGFFGEMSLLTGESRSATVKAVVDSELLEITADAFRQFVLANPAAVEQIGLAVAKRSNELNRHRAEGSPTVTPEASHTLIARIRKFLHR
ncbi:MAG TPA: mechanosensitive ion channel family protein [Vicinamibacterales bacterium]|jgi:small-conductance mechanosensitive channel|nr:mechanosensitive ion channel family protein [Vicinamibacterales bacterium]